MIWCIVVTFWMFFTGVLGLEIVDVHIKEKGLNRNYSRKTWTLIGSRTLYGSFFFVLSPYSIFPM